VDGARAPPAHARAALTRGWAADLAASDCLIIRAPHRAGSTIKEPGINNSNKYAQHLPIAGVVDGRFHMIDFLAG
jgi:hypothetical protein